MAHPLRSGLDRAPSPFAITTGADHRLVYGNRSFLQLFGGSRGVAGEPIADLLTDVAVRLGPLLDRVLTSGVAVHDQFLGRLTRESGVWSGSIWPLLGSDHDPEGLMMELRTATHMERTAALQREVAERLLLSALREAESADAAEAARASSAFLLEAGRRLGGSFDEAVTRGTMAGLSLPVLGAWCIVDVIEADGDLTRLAMIHPDAAKQEMVRTLAESWRPHPGDPFGAPAVMHNAQPVVAHVRAADLEAALSAASHGAANLQLLRDLEVGPLLTVPMVSHGELLGAITFVSARADRAYTPEQVELAESLAARSAEALNSARLYGEAISLREQAEESSHSRMRFLGNISHELRTPLNAISGYTELMAGEVHGPITDAQRRDLERIRLNQEHLLVLITDILNFVRAGLTPVTENVAVPVADAVSRALALVENLALRKSIHYRNEVSDPDLLADADPDRLQQILINLLSNAIKFTPWEGMITTRCEATPTKVEISVSDTGIGIDPEKAELIFEPFVQVDPKGEVSGGVGLGLAISRDLARAMRGDLTVESEPGKGACFTLVLPRRLH